MDKYDYYIEVTNDIECWMDKDEDLFDLSQFENREEAAEFLYDELWNKDSVTGNGANFYTDEETCEEYLCHNFDLIFEACESCCIDWKSFLEHYKKHNLARFLDCLVRLYVLPDAIERALITWKSYEFKYKE